MQHSFIIIYFDSQSWQKKYKLRNLRINNSSFKNYSSVAPF